MNTQKLYSIAMFMIVLIIMLPIIQAQQLNIQRFSGRGNYTGYADKTDVLTVEATVQGDVAPGQMRIFSDGTYFFFDKCAPEANGAFTKCIYNTPITGASGVEQYAIKLFDSPTSNNLVEETKQTLTIDSIAPNIKTFELTPAQSSSGTVQIHYNIEEKAFDPTDPNTCSGLKDIILTYGKQTLMTQPGEKACSAEKTFVQDIQAKDKYSNEDLCIKATDMVGHETKSCKKFIVDNSPPNIKELIISNEYGQKITHARTGEEKTANIVVVIEGNQGDVDSNTVSADLSKLNSELGTKNPDANSGSNYVWSNVKITSPNTCEVIVTASDKLGNSDTKTLTCKIGVDDTPPVVKSITTGFTDEGKALLSKKGTITVEFDDNAGSGMNHSNAYLDLTALGLGSNERANKCYLDGNWKCNWPVEPKTTGAKTITVTTETADDAGNKITQAVKQEVNVDVEPPKILSDVATKILHNNVEVKDVAVSGDTIEWTVKVSGQETAFGNFSEVSDADKVEGSCVEFEKAQQCTFSAVVTKSGPYLADVYFEFIDKAGNKARAQSKLNVYGESTQKPNFWKVQNIRCSPQMIDRETASLYAHPVYCAVNLEQQNTKTKAEPILTLLPDPSKCRGDIPEYISNVELRNNGLKSKKPVILLTLEPAKFEVNAINITCPIAVYTKLGKTVVQQPEEKQIKFNLSFYNLPYGELNKNMNDDIDDAVKSSESFWKIIGTIEKFVGYAEKFCQIKNIITSILTTLDLILLTFGATATALSTNPLTANAGVEVDSVRQTLCGGAKGPIEQFYTSGGTGTLFEVLDNFCAFVDCRLSSSKEGKFGDNMIRNSGAILSGGGVPGLNWCQSIQNMLEFGGKEVNFGPAGKFNAPNLFGNLGTKDVNAGLKGQGTDVQQQEQLISVKDSLVWSTACLCVPGILYNLNKYRQIQCRYATCLMEDVKNKGIPKSYCADTKHYQTCTFVMGEIFSLLPIMTFLDKIYNVLTDVLSNPFAALSTVAGCLCGGCMGVFPALIDWCRVPYGEPAYWGCISMKTLSKVSDVAASIQGLTKMADKSYWQTSNDWCEQMDKANDRRNQQSKPQTTDTTNKPADETKTTTPTTKSSTTSSTSGK